MYKTLRKLQAGLSTAIFSLVFVFILQNMETVETDILFFTLELPRTVLVFLVGFVCFIAGLLFAIKNFDAQIEFAADSIF
ncbi:MAG: putative integral membrane protein [Candidatus Azotimanducaceae bacterium]|jgi:uncharacterized integral membrane protein